MSSLSVYGSTTDQQGELLKTVTDFDGKDSMDISVPLTGKAGSTVYLDLVAESNVTAYVQKTDGTYEDVHFHSLYAWNDMNFIKQFMVNGAITKSVPTCGIVTLKAQPKSATATYGTPTIDGTMIPFGTMLRPLMSTPSAWAMVQPERQRCSGMKTTSMF